MRMLKKNGFTLIEMIITIAVIAILAGIATPYFLGQLERQGIKTAAMDINKMIQQTKGVAVKENRDCTITFNSADNTCTVDCLNVMTRLENYRGRVRFGKPPGEARESAAAMTFNSRGLCTNGGDVFITNSKGNIYYRFMVPLTGYAAMYKWDGGAWI
jgi:prepilin-type N-terminal cleavage/methylation domain-containing protein